MAAPTTSDTEIVVLAGDPNAAERSARAAHRPGGDGYLLFGLLVGAVCGAAVGLLRAPQRGEETRQRLLGSTVQEQTRRAPSEATDAVAQILQYSTPAPDEAARLADPDTTATAPGL